MTISDATVSSRSHHENIFMQERLTAAVTRAARPE